MGSSSHDYAGNRPDVPAPDGKLHPTPGGEPPAFQSFLPKDPHAMATGLTPGMLKGIAATLSPSPAPPSGEGSAAAAGDTQQQLPASVPPELRDAPPSTQQAYADALGKGDKAGAQKILLAALVAKHRQGGFTPLGSGTDRGGYTTSGGGSPGGGSGWGGEGSKTGGVGGLSSGGLY